MGIAGFQYVASDEASSLDVAKGYRSCLTYGLALACDAVFDDGKTAFARIEELTATLGVDDVLLVLKDNLASIGKLKANSNCAMPGMDTMKMRMMVFQLHLFRMMQEATVQAAEARG